MPDTYADTEHTHVEQLLKALGAKTPTLCDLYYFNHLKMWLAEEVDFGKSWPLGQYALCTKCTWSFSLPVRLESCPLVVSVTLPDTRSENLCATRVAPSLGEFQGSREWIPGLFCGKLFKLELGPQRLPFWHSRLKAQFTCNKIKPPDALKCLSCIHTQACMCTEGPGHAGTQTQLTVSWARNRVRCKKVTYFPILSIFFFLNSALS